MKRFDLSFCYKGARQYIHGTDMLSKSIDLLRNQLDCELSNLGFAIRRMTDRNLSLDLYSSDQAPELFAQNVAVLAFDALGKSWAAHLSETGDQPNCRYPYDENAVVKLCAIDRAERSIALLHEAPYSAIETLVAMTKALHLDVFPNLNGSWAFCRWESPRWPLSGSLDGVRVQMVQALGTRLTKSEISLEGEVLGHVYFSARDSQ